MRLRGDRGQTCNVSVLRNRGRRSGCGRLPRTCPAGCGKHRSTPHRAAYASDSAPGTLAHTIESKNHTEVTNRRSTDGGIDPRTARAMSELFSAPWTSWRGTLGGDVEAALDRHQHELGAMGNTDLVEDMGD